MSDDQNVLFSKIRSFSHIAEFPRDDYTRHIVTLDKLGRVVIPKDLLCRNKIAEKQTLFVLFDKPALVIKQNERGYEDCFYAKRKVDGFGRIVLPADMRQQLGMHNESQLSIYGTDDGEIVIEKISFR